MTRRRLRFRLVASVLMLGIVGAMLEVGARTVGDEIPEWKLVDSEGVIMTGHPTRLWGLSPGIKHNGDAIATINDLGMRGKMPETPKPAGQTRVLVVGDSTFFGHGVGDDDTFPAQLEARLKETVPGVEVLNAAVPGYSTEQTLITMEELGWSLEPDLLVIGNLWSDNNIDTFRDEDLLKTARVYQGNPLFQSAFFRLLAGTIDRARGGTGAHLVNWTRDSQWPQQGERRVSLERYAQNLDTLVREAAARGIGAAIIAPCNVGQVKKEYPDGASWDPFFDAQRAVAEFHHIPWIRTLPAMQEAAGADATHLFVDQMHPSVEGHAVFAGLARDTLVAAGWPNNHLLATSEVFPADTLVDNGFKTGRSNPRSPQRNLYTNGVEEGSKPLPGTESHQPGDGPPAAGDGPSLRPPTNADGTPALRWEVTGTVTGGTAPLRVELRTSGGQVVSRVTMGAPGEFQVHVRGDVDAVDVVVTDAAGATTSAPAERTKATVALAL